MAKRKRSSKKRSSAKAYGVNSGTIRAISATGFLVLGILSFLSIFSSTLFLSLLNNSFTSLFGVGFFFIPFLAIFVSFYLWQLKFEIAKPHVVAGFTIFLLSFITLVAMFSTEFAGQIGLQIWVVLSQLLTIPGAFVFCMGSLAVGILVLFNISYKDVVTGIGSFVATTGSAFSHAKEKRPVSEEIQKHLEPKIQGGDLAKQQQNGQAGQTNSLGTAVIANLPTEGYVWEYPPLSILSDAVSKKAERGDVKHNATVIERTLDSFGIQARVAEINLGPAVTQYALEITLGTKLSKITGLQNDMALALAAPTGAIRIEAPIPGKSLVGIEIPNNSLEVVSMKSILSSDTMINHKSRLAVALGYDVSGQPVVADIAKMPHLLMAGTTGSGKSVAINTFICSLLFRCSPQELKLILVDPKRVEMSSYNGIPHLLTPVIVEVDKILAALTWATTEMDRRYKLFAQVGVRNIEGYNERSGFQALPYIVIVIDELADLMMFSPVEVEDAITRLAQMARAVGIHLVIATQRPSVDVLTGLIKANIPARISFNVSSMIDSRVILDQPGAEKLLGRGDMLYVGADTSKATRIQGVYSDPEVNALVGYLKATGIQPEYAQGVTDMVYSGGRGAGSSSGSGGGGSQDVLFDDAVKTIFEYDQASASLLQRRLKVGYARAARLVDELEAAGVIGPPQGSKSREIKFRSADEYFNKRSQAAEAA